MNLLTIVSAVLRYSPSVGGNEFAAPLIDAYLAPSAGVTLEAAFRLRSPRLMNCIVWYTPKTLAGQLKLSRDFNRALSQAFYASDVFFAALLVVTCSGMCVTDGIEAASCAGNTTLLRWMKEADILACWSQTAVVLAARAGHLHTLEFFHRETTAPFTRNIIGQCARRRDPRLLQWVLANTGLRPDNRDLAEACGSGRLGNLSLLSSWVGDIPDTCAIYAARQGHLAVVMWLHRHGGAFSASVMDTAAESGHLLFVKWLSENRGEGCTPYAMDSASQGGHLDVVEWLFVNRTVGCTDVAMSMAVISNRLNVGRWLHSNLQRAWTGPLLDIAVRYGSRELIQWVHETFPSSYTSAAMDYAAGQGDIDTVIWLHNNRPEGCTMRAMDIAAAREHIDIVKWLHAHRSEVCSARAIDGAASNGHLGIVKWLHDVRRAPCTTAAMNSAATYGYIDVVQWLNENRAEGCTEAAMDAAASIEGCWSWVLCTSCTH